MGITVFVATANDDGEGTLGVRLLNGFGCASQIRFDVRLEWAHITVIRHQALQFILTGEPLKHFSNG